MKKYLALVALSLVSSSAFAITLDCITASGRDAGRLLIAGNRLEYFQTNGSAEGWQLIVQGGTIFNNDINVHHGQEIAFGKIAEITGGVKLLSFAGRGDLICR